MDGENGSGLIVCPHDGDQTGVFIDFAFEALHVELSQMVDRDLHDFDALALPVFETAEDSGMLDRAGDDLAAFRKCGYGGVDGGVIALSSAAGEDDLGGDTVFVAGGSSEEFSDFAAGVFDIG